jgi:Smg protein
MSQIKEHKGQIENIDDVSSYLKSHGFTENEISSAYSWVLDQMQSDSQFLADFTQSEYSTRVFSDQDKRYFTTDALGYIVQLRHLGLLSDSQIELILERGVFVGSTPIDLNHIKIIIGSMLFRETEVVDVSRQQVYLFPDDDGPVN